MGAVSGDKAEVTVFCVSTNQVSMNILNYRLQMDTGVNIPEQQVCDAMNDYLQPQWIGLMSEQAFYQGVSFRLTHSGVTGGYYYKKSRTAGAVSGDQLPRQTAWCASWRTTGAGRSKRGRTYYPFPPESRNTVDGYPSADFMVAARLSSNNTLFTSNLTTSDDLVFSATLQVYSQRLNSYQDVDHRVAAQKWATMRRRGDYGRPNVLPDALA